MEYYDSPSEWDRENARRSVELVLWIIISVVTGLFAYFRAPTKGIALLGSSELLWALIPLFFPVIFLLIFSNLPIAALRANRLRARQPKKEGELKEDSSARRSVEINVQIEPEPNEAMSFEQLSQSSPTTLMAYFASNSRRLAKTLFTRAGVYLFIGVMVAFSGLVFFYTQTSNLARSAQDVNIMALVEFAPKFGILLFIELVAFFFLRQYRAAMDEFRHFEAIQRRREENLAILRLFETSDEKMAVADLVKTLNIFSSAGTLDSGQSTELIETRKLEKNEIELLGKMLETIASRK